MNKIEQTNVAIQGFPPLPNELTYNNLLPFVLENRSGPALAQTCKGLQALMTTFLQNYAISIRKEVKSKDSRFYRAILSSIDQPLNNPGDHYRYIASIAKIVKAFDERLTQRVVYAEEIQLIGQGLEDVALEKIWPRIIAEVEKAYPDFVLNPKRMASDIRASMREHADLLREIQKLNLNLLELTDLPDEIGQLTGLRELSLFSNKLTELPSEISKLKNLTLLTLSKNRFTVFPSVTNQLKSLTLLDLGYNQLVALPSEISELTNLRVLGLINNRFTKIPDEISSLQLRLLIFKC